MADIFISYAREDRGVAQQLARMFERHGLSVWWDREVLPGDTFTEVITTELNAARCVMVIWSTASLASRWVRDEAQEGLERQILVPVLIDAVIPPMGFRSVHAADLTDWDGEDEHQQWLRITKAVSTLLAEAGPSRTEPATAGSPFKVSKHIFGKASRWPRRRVLTWVASLGISAITAAVLVNIFIGGKNEDARPPHGGESVPVTDAAKTFRDCERCPEMVELAPGAFRIGASWFDRESQSDERPAVAVEISEAYAIGRHEITFDDWQACVDDGGCLGYAPDDNRWGRGVRPVIYVSWDDIQSYIVWLRGKTGKDYRLPTEAEWEYACRAGTATKYPFGDGISPAFANYGRNILRTQDVGKYRPNPWGLYDMNGNVWEWVEDVYNDGHGGRPEDGRAWLEGPEEQERVIRGGSWDDRARRVRCISRNGKDRDQRENEIGFRVALSCELATKTCP